MCISPMHHVSGSGVGYCVICSTTWGYVSYYQQDVLFYLQDVFSSLNYMIYCIQHRIVNKIKREEGRNAGCHDTCSVFVYGRGARLVPGTETGPVVKLLNFIY